MEQRVFKKQIPKGVLSAWIIDDANVSTHIISNNISFLDCTQCSYWIFIMEMMLVLKVIRL
jgi:hypothetical protein